MQPNLNLKRKYLKFLRENSVPHKLRPNGNIICGLSVIDFNGNRLAARLGELRAISEGANPAVSCSLTVDDLLSVHNRLAVINNTVCAVGGYAPIYKISTLPDPYLLKKIKSTEIKFKI